MFRRKLVAIKKSFVKTGQNIKKNCCCCFQHQEQPQESFKEGREVVGFVNPMYGIDEDIDYAEIEKEMSQRQPTIVFDNPLFDKTYKPENENPMDPTSISYDEWYHIRSDGEYEEEDVFEDANEEQGEQTAM